ncbi:MAG: hypothetical protein EON61_02585 [Alphaproteobacteria bacterium]|nr:MAG: hypothetical protein EON61_02585 [Alphaproteobacteria bacterium]
MDFGLPSGPGLWSNVKEIVSSIRDGLTPRNPYADDPLITLAHLMGRGSNSPQAKAMLSTLRGRAPDPQFRLAEIAGLMNNADVHASVDDFLRDHPSIRPEIKIAIAAALFEKLYAQHEETKVWVRSSDLLSDRLHLRPTGETTNWCKKFVGACRPFLRGVDSPAKLTIINFNYDRLLETILRHYWDMAETTYPPFESCFEFLYPYGAFSDLPTTIVAPAPWICQQADAIGLADGFNTDASDILKARLSASQNIFCVGFSCAKANEQLLGLNAHHAWKIFYQNFNAVDIRLDRVMKRLGVRTDRRDTANMATLVTNGFFEQDAATLPKD